MKIKTAILTLFNVVAWADGKIADEEKKMIFEVLTEQFNMSEQELEKNFDQNLDQIKKNAPEMIKEAVLVLREECSQEDVNKVLTLLKELSLSDKILDPKEMMIIEMLEQLVAVDG